MSKLPLELNEHKHRWIERNEDIWYCDQGDCKTIRMSAAENSRRLREWDNFYDLVRTTEAHQDFVDIKKAYFEKNKPEVAHLVERANSRLMANEYLEQPRFADPRDRKYEVVE